MMKACCVLLLLTVFATPSPLSEAAKGMSPNTWRNFTSNLSNGMIMGGPKMASSLSYADNIVWGSVSKRLYFIGSAHGSISKFLVYDDSTNNWYNEVTPREPADDNNRVGHNYDCGTIVPERNEFWRMTYVGPDFIFKYKCADKKWDTVRTTGVFNNYACVMQYFPAAKYMVNLDRFVGQISFMHIDSLRWSAPKYIYPSSYHAFAEYNPKHRCMLLGGGSDNRIWKLDTNLVLTQLKNAPFPELSVIASEIICDSASGKYLVLTQGAFHSYDIITDTWEQIPFQSEPVKNIVTKLDVSNAIIGGSIPEYGIAVFITTGAYPMLIYKYGTANESEKNSGIKNSPSISASPNPCNPASTIECIIPSGQTGKLLITDINGKTVNTVKNITGRRKINFTASASKIYLCRLETSAGSSHTLKLFTMK
ncbi:MAG: hypothetical protein JNL74_16145 [Fibrobacteres bacterium]|nr:hypothetical protein [Fibrobacterota bacterium]